MVHRCDEHQLGTRCQKECHSLPEEIEFQDRESKPERNERKVNDIKNDLCVKGLSKGEILSGKVG